jgi:hypothetical protein
LFGLGLIGVLLLVITLFPVVQALQSPPALQVSSATRKNAVGRYLRSGQLLADIHTAAGMLQYIFTPEADGASWIA